MKKLFLTILLSACYFNGFSQKGDSIKIKKHPILDNKIYFNAGVYIPDKRIKLTVAGDTPGEIINFDKAFGTKESETTFAGNFVWSFTKKWRLGLEYFSLKNTKDWKIDEDITWDDKVYQAGANLEAGLKLNIYRISIGRVIASGNKYEFGGGIGVHAINVITSLAGGAYVDSSETSFETVNFNFTAPLPNLNTWFYYAPTTRLALTARIDWLAVSLGEYGGGLWNLAPGIKYQVFKNFGMALNYRYLHLNVDVKKEHWNSELDIIYQGPLFTLTGNF